MIIELSDVNIEAFFHYASVQITGFCNMNCKHCRAKDEPQVYMDIALFNKILDFIDANRENDDFQITISGGEPLLHPNLIQLLKSVKKRNINYVFITTNGYFITEKLLTNIDELNIKNIWLYVSMDSVTESKHDEFRRFKGAYKKAWQNIKLIKQHNSNIIVAIRMTVTRDTLFEMEDMVELCLKNGVKHIEFQAVVPFGTATENSDLVLTSKEKTTFLNTIAYLKNKYEGTALIMSECPQKVAVPNSPWKYEENILDEKNYFSGCTAGIDYFNIGADGIVTPCATLDEAIFNFHDVKNVEEMTDIYTKSPVVKNLLERKFKGNCGKCKLYRACGGCRAMAKALTGDYLGEDSSCEFCV